MLRIDLEYKRGILFARLSGNLSYKNSYKINNYLIPVLKKHQIKYLVYNLANLKKMDLKGRDAILNSKYIMKQNKGKVLFCKVNSKIDEILKGMRISKIKNERDAMALVRV